MSGFLLEVEFSLEFEGESFPVDFECCHPKARIVDVGHRIDRRADGSVEREYGVLVVRDDGVVAEANLRRSALVVRRMGRLCPLPDSSGRLIGSFSSHHGGHHWFVFDATSSTARPHVTRRQKTPGKTAEEPSSPPPETASAPQESRSASSGEVKEPEEPDFWQT